MTAHVGIGGAYKTVSSAWVGVSSAWKSVTGMWVGVDGAWKSVFEGGVNIVGGSVIDFAFQPNSASASYSLTSSGQEVRSPGGSHAWTDSGDGSAYEARATLTSGELPSGTIGAWLSLATTRSWSVSRASVGSSSATLTIEIRAAGKSEILDTASVTITATVESGA